MESNLDLMAHLAQPLRAGVRVRRVARSSQRGVRRLCALGLIVLLVGGGFLWFRDSDVVAIREVTITGVSSSQEAPVRDALRRAALDMTTLHVRRDDLRAAVASYASVADLRAEAEFPDALRIEVVERFPAALLVAGDQKLPVSAGGLLLRGVRPEAQTPTVRMGRLPIGSRLNDRRARSAVSVLAAAPPELRGRIERARVSARGLTLELHDGPDLVFGSVSRLEAKWLAASRVLADSGAKGATYLDLRLPEWVAAGGVGPLESDEGASAAGSTTLPVEPQP